MKKHKENFLADEFFSLVIQATFQRSPTYEEKAHDRQKVEFKYDLRGELEKLSEIYKNPVSEGDHITNIKNLSNSLSTKHSACLINGRFRIGSAQKALNLHLKYMWCLGLIPEPPHCPFDSIIIKKLPVNVAKNWTELDDIEDYKVLVNAAKLLAVDNNLPSWELVVYNEA